MVQSDFPIGRTKSGKINAKWYFDRLKSSPIYYSQKNNSNSTITIQRGTTASKGKQIPRIYLISPAQSNQQNNRRSSSINISSARSLRSNSNSNKISPPLLELNPSNDHHESNKLNFKDNLSIARRSSSTNLSIKPDLIQRPPSTPVDRRCQRIYSSNKNSIEKETCQLLGPQLCSDCIEIETRSNLSSEHLPKNLIRQRLLSLAIRRFIPNETFLNDNQLLQIINHQQNKFINLYHLTDEQYFNHLSSSLNQYSNQIPFYFKDLKDFSIKYQSNKYPRLLLSETPPPQSSNPIFKQSLFEKFDISPKYASMKRASTAKPNLKSNAQSFISPKKSEVFYQQHRYLTDYSPPLLSQRLQFNSNLNVNKKFQHSLINSKSSNQ